MSNEAKSKNNEQNLPKPVEGPAPEIAHDEHGTVAASKVKHPKRGLKIAIALIVLALALLGFIWFAMSDDAVAPTLNENPQPVISSYEECAAAGYPILESYPEQCAVPGGETFTNPDAIVLDEQYTNDLFEFSFSYPGTWELEETDEGTEANPRTTVVLSKDGEPLINFSAFVAGIGGACIPETNDEPHDVDSACDTREFLEVEPISTQVPKLDLSAGPSNLYSTDMKYTRVRDIDEGTFYQVCLLDDGHMKPQKGEPEMGIFFNLIDVGIETSTPPLSETEYQFSACSAEYESQDFLSSPEGEHIRSVLNSVEFNLAA